MKTRLVTDPSGTGSRRSLFAVIVMLAALATSLTLLLGLSVQPAAAQDRASKYLDQEEMQALSEAEQSGLEAEPVGIVNAKASKNPDSLNFGPVRVGTSTTRLVTVKGDAFGCVDVFFGCIGNFPAKVDSATVIGDDFSKASDTCSGRELDPNETCTIEVRFGPDNEGFHSGSLSISPGSVTLVDLPVVGTISVPTSFVDGTVVPLSGTGNIAPQVIAFSPTGRKVSPGANATATFSEDMLAGSINSSSFTLRKQSSSLPVPAVVTYDPITDKATLNPNSNLKRGATYLATVTTGARDLLGEPLAAQKSWSFRVKPR
jgi:hypothetical protein